MSSAATPTAAASLPADRAHRAQWVIFAAVLLGSMMGAIDTSIVNVALAHIQATYGVTTDDVAWVVTGYLITLVIVMPLTAWLSALIGRRRFYVISIVLFTGASILCGLSRTLGQLIAFRVIQGIGGGAVRPIAQAIMREGFPVERQAQAQGLYGMILQLGPAIGPTLGGWLTDNYAWPWIFFINVPVGIAAVLMGLRFIEDPPYARARRGVRLDAAGIALMAIGLTALQTVLERGERDAWFQSAFITVSALVAAFALAAFIVWELRAAAPAVNLRIFRDRSFLVANLMSFTNGIALFGVLLMLPLFLQNLLGYDATDAGLALMPRSLAMVTMLPLAGMLYNRLGVHVMAPIGLVLAAGSGFMMGRFTLSTGPAQILLPQVIQGIGFAFLFVPVATTALGRIPRPQMQAATGLYNLVFQLGGSFGTALVIALYDHRLATASAYFMHYASPYNPVFRQWWQEYQSALMLRWSGAWLAHRQALAALNLYFNQQAAVIAFEYVFTLMACGLLACLPLVLLLRRPAGPRDAESSTLE
jgi:MFS transporter, DHA2 family, multidrug resistance protein